MRIKFSFNNKKFVVFATEIENGGCRRNNTIYTKIAKALYFCLFYTKE